MPAEMADISAKVPVALKKAVREYADREMRSESQIVRMALAKFLNTNVEYLRKEEKAQAEDTGV